MFPLFNLRLILIAFFVLGLIYGQSTPIFEASDEALLRRFSETRRPHPLAPTGSVIEGILAERSKLRQIKKMADRVLDTSDLTAVSYTHLTLPTKA